MLTKGDPRGGKLSLRPSASGVVNDGQFRTLHLTSKTHSIFLIACGRSKESLSIPGHTQDNLEPIPSLGSLDSHQKQKYEILDSPCISYP